MVRQTHGTIYSILTARLKQKVKLLLINRQKFNHINKIYKSNEQLLIHLDTRLSSTIKKDDYKINKII